MSRFFGHILNEQRGHHNEKASRPLLDPKRPPASRELARANLVLRYCAVRSRQWNGKHDLDVDLLRLQQLMRNGDAASVAPTLAIVDRRRRAIDPG
jgi:hypothetical protein